MYPAEPDPPRKTGEAQRVCGLVDLGRPAMRLLPWDMLRPIATLGAQVVALVGIGIFVLEIAVLSGSRRDSPPLLWPVHDLVSLDRGRFVAVSAGRSVAVGDVWLGTLADRSPKGLEPLALAGPLPDGRVLIGCANGAVMLWSPEGGEFEARSLARRTDAALPSAFDSASALGASADGRLVAKAAAGAPAGTISVWDLERNSPPVSFAVGGAVDAIGFLSDSQSLVAYTDDGTVSVWNALTGERLRSIRCGGGGPGSVACSRDGPLVAWCGVESPVCDRLPVRAWDVSTGQPLWRAMVRLRRPAPQAVPQLAVSADGTQLACGTDDAITLFDATQGVVLGRADATGHATSALRFTEGDGALVSAGQDGTVRWWELPDVLEIRRVENRLYSERR